MTIQVRTFAIVAALLLSSEVLIPISELHAQNPGDVPEDELIVRLRPFPQGPRPSEVVDAVRGGSQVPHGIGVGYPVFAEFLLPARLEGRMKEFYDENPDLPRARLERSVILHYPTPRAARGIMTALENLPAVEYVEQNRPLLSPVTLKGTASQAPEIQAREIQAPENEAPEPISQAATLGPCESTAGSVPSDPFFAPPVGDCDPTKYQWGSYALRLPEAWQYITGHAKVFLVDMGLQTDHEDLKPFGSDGLFSDWFIGGNFRSHLSYQYVADRCDVDETTQPEQERAVHGTHTSGILAATPNNGDGVAGTCWHCPLVMASFNVGPNAQASLSIAATAITEGADKGIQVGSMSFGIDDACPAPPGHFGSESMCDTLDNYSSRDIVFVGASGNDLLEVELPAIHDDVVAVGAIETDGTHWTRLDDDCDNNDECGSNFAQDPQERTLDLVAPGQFVLSTVYTGEGYVYPGGYDDDGCGDQYPDDGNGGNDADGYGACTGTSMASPYTAGALALLRSANPLMRRGQLKQIMIDSSSLSPAWDPKLGYGLPDVAEAVERTLGVVDGTLLTNRATPMFRLYSATHGTHLFTSSPQAAVAEIEGVGGGNFAADPAGSTLGGYPTLPGDTQPVARASFWVFSGPTAPDDPQVDLVPIYRLTRDRDEGVLDFCGDGATTTHRAWGYATTPGEIRLFHRTDTFADGVRYFPEGIEGYIYPTTSTPPSGAEKLYRYYNDGLDDWLLLLESESPPAGYDDSLTSSGTAPNGLWIGWALPHVDSDGDGVIDAWEDLIGTDPQLSDSDADGCSDGEEILGFTDPTESRLSDPLDGLCLYHVLFLDGFESGDTSAWD